MAKPGPVFGGNMSDDEEEEEIEEIDEDDLTGGQFEIDEGDAAIIEKFMTRNPAQKVNLADLIMSKINQSMDPKQRPSGDVTPAQKRQIQNQEPEIDPKIVEVYSKVGVLLSNYRSGKLPKAFKIIPSLSNWEEILMITSPHTWTPHATYQATRVFVSNLGAKMAQRFFSLFLLDRIRDDIADTKKLNYHLYLALKKSLYKPGAFFKGLLLPLCEVNLLSV
jgi:essential nuclear protein 1